jgi:hypothetical protein
VIAVLAAIPFTLGRYFELNYPDPFDSGANVYSAKHILDGARIGVEERPSAALGTLLVNMLGVWLCGFNETGPKLIQGLFQAGALILMFIAMRKLFGTLSAAVGVIVASIYLSAPLVAKFGNVKEQYMISCMVIGVSSFVLRYLGGKWWWAVLAGAFLSWGPLFKETGSSAIGATGLFLILQPVLKHRTWRQTGTDILLLAAGGVLAVGPLYVWIIGWDVQMSLPYAFVWKTLRSALPVKAAASTSGGGAGYVAGSRRLVPFSEQWPRVLRFYCLLILPIALAVGAVGARILRLLRPTRSEEQMRTKVADRFVLLFGVWWILDAAFVWISPRSYEQYYLPLTASAAMLGGYLVALYGGRLVQKPRALTTPGTATLDIVFLGLWTIGVWITVRAVLFGVVQDAGRYGQYQAALSAAIVMLGLGLVGLLRDKLSNGINAFRWGLAGVVGLVSMAVMVWPILFGIKTSAHTGRRYSNPDMRNGYAQRWDEISWRRAQKGKMAFEQVGEYIRLHSDASDKIYVWGWYPGIYITAQRFSAASKPVMMPRPAPQALADSVAGLLDEFGREAPKFIVDSRKLHIPTNRPPYELWPLVPRGFMGTQKTDFLPLDKNVIATYDRLWAENLRKYYDEDEALRYEALKPLRDFVMQNYRIVRMFGRHVLFQLKQHTAQREPQ